VEHAVLELELIRAIRQKRIEGTRYPVDVFGMHSLKPGLPCVADLVFFASHEAGPSWREVKPVGDQVPAPQSLTLPPGADEV
jgi:hypothetical protein